jgi:heme-degrading monooxygenase HmoA
VFVSISIHHPRQRSEQELIASMHRYGAAARTQKGLREVHTLRDQRTGVLVGLAIWENREAKTAAGPALAAATAGDDFDSWESEPAAVFSLEEI